MKRHASFRGVLTPVITPFTATLEPDLPRLVRQCRWLLANDVGLAVFGTNSEGNALSTRERVALLEGLAGNGIPMHRVMAGTGACSLDDAVTLTRAAVELGCGGVLMLPPFYYKEPSDAGLFRFYEQTIARVGDDRLAVYLYHIPPVAKVGFSLTLVQQLLEHFPGTVRGIKDTGGDLAYTQALLANCASDDFDVFAGSETELVTLMEAGAAGCISATANVNPAGLVDLYRNFTHADARSRQQRANAVRAAFARHPMIPALKAALAFYLDDPSLCHVRPPFVELAPDAQAQLIAELQALDFNPRCVPAVAESPFNSSLVH
ncbi:dihydrodipicolinate synthase family protein [Burkholderia sp. Ac-20353]|uniref:dihydrodipicolinate synthase family protein n=1 Tax=Burkholderia sp. Ac-20353 TaxID=2703894 RepID=UPI00197B1484|nr:dihydrodipicolinate synthase family protein [Burkholderia sp. Ac-20353]MBN3786860.1 dihydrodipicolinate synthase family protein [Burkholderia sp. Ac-20353]